MDAIGDMVVVLTNLAHLRRNTTIESCIELKPIKLLVNEQVK